jgi:hypothetical protein
VAAISAATPARSIDAVLLDLGDEGASSDTEQLRSARLVPSRLLECLDDPVSLELVDGPPQVA